MALGSIHLCGMSGKYVLNPLTGRCLVTEDDGKTVQKVGVGFCVHSRACMRVLACVGMCMLVCVSLLGFGLVWGNYFSSPHDGFCSSTRRDR